MADTPIPGSPLGPDLNERRQQEAKVNAQHVEIERVRQALSPEAREKPRTAEELISLISRGWEEEAQARIEQRYGKGRWASIQAWLAGERDVSISETGEEKTSLLSEVGRKFFRTAVNKRTILSGVALAGIGFLTGGTGMPAAHAWTGGNIGQALGEVWSVVRGNERKARLALLKAERDGWYELKELAVKWSSHVGDPAEREGILKEIAERYYQSSTDALTKARQDGQAALQKIVQVEGKLRRNLAVIGGLFGLGHGLLEAQAAAATGGVEGGQAAFGGVDTDLDGKLHAVYQENATWNYVYSSAEEAVKAGHEGDFSHYWGNLGVERIYAYAAAKAVPILAGFTSPEIGRGFKSGLDQTLIKLKVRKSGELKDPTEEEKRNQRAEYERIASTFGKARPPGSGQIEDSIRQELASPSHQVVFKDAQGKYLRLVPKPNIDSLELLVDQGGKHIDGHLDPSNPYEVQYVDEANNLIKLHEQKTGKMIYVDLLKLRPLILGFEGKDAHPIVPSEKEKEALKAEAKANWEKSLSELTDLGEPKLEPGTLWVIRPGHEIEHGLFVAGPEKGHDIELVAGRYQVTRLDPARKAVILRSLNDPDIQGVEVPIKEFVKNVVSESRHIRNIFKAREKAGDLVPPNYKIEPKQTYDYRHEDGPAAGHDKGMLVYKVVSVKDNMVELTPDPPGTPNRIVDPAVLADKARFRP